MKTSTPLIKGAGALVLFALVASATTSRADQYDVLRNDAEIENGVLIVAIGDVIRDNCPNIEDRRARSIPFLLGLVRQAQSHGFSRAEVEAYVDNPAERARVEGLAAQWFAQEGADLADPETICAVARSEISAQTAIGRLIRER